MLINKNDLTIKEIQDILEESNDKLMFLYVNSTLDVQIPKKKAEYYYRKINDNRDKLLKAIKELNILDKDNIIEIQKLYIELKKTLYGIDFQKSLTEVLSKAEALNNK